MPRKRSKKQQQNKAGPAADVRAADSQVEQAVVGEGSKKNYVGHIAQFGIFLYDKHPEHLVDEHRANMDEAHEKDKTDEKTAKARTNLRNYIVHATCALQAKKDDQPHNCFIKIEDEEDALSYNTVLEYFNTKYNVHEVDRSAAESYLKAVRDGSGESFEITSAMEVEGEGDKVRVKVYQSFSQYSGIRNAIAWVYTLTRVGEMPFKSELRLYLKGAARYIAAAKQHLGLKITEGKDEMKQAVYELIAEHLFKSGKREDILYHLIFLLDWNLMKRAENCMNAKMIHINFTEDHMTFEFAKEKGKQHGDMHGPWHCFANPEKEHICLLLAFAKYIFTFTDVLKDGAPLFEGTNQYGRYSTRLHQVFRELKDDLKDLGVDWTDLGTHSTRKGVGTMVANASTVGPPIVALCLRAGWTLGGVKEKYLFRADGGDMAVGRRAACLEVDDKGFAISPPYFDYTHLDGDERIKTKAKVERFLKAKLPDDIPPNSWNLALQCFASVCFHHKYLSEELDVKCSFRHTSVFRQLPEEFKELATVRFPRNKTTDTPKFNGIPPHVLHIVKIESLERKIDNLKKDLLAGLVDEMDKRGFSSTSYKTSDITDAISAIAEKMTTEMKALKDDLQNSRNVPTADYVIDDSAGVVIPRTAIVDEDGVFDNFDTNETEGEEGDKPRESEQRRLQRKRKQREASDEAVKKRRYRVGHHHGRLNVLPANYVFPSLGPKDLCENWLLGSEDQNIPPLCLLTSKDVNHLQSGNKQRNKLKSIMRVVERMAREKNVWIEKTCDWDSDKVDKMWDAIETEFKQLYCQAKRTTQITVSLVYRNMTAANAFGNRKNKKEIEKRQQQQQAALQDSVV